MRRAVPFARARPGVARRPVAAARGPRRAAAARPPGPRRDGLRARPLAAQRRRRSRTSASRSSTTQPGSGATVAYDVTIAGARHVAVATAGHALCPEAVRTDARRAVARALGRDSPIARPLTYDVGLGALVQWYPLDLAMPVLARPVPELLRLARAHGDRGRARRRRAARPSSTARASAPSSAPATSSSRPTPRTPRSARASPACGIAAGLGLGAGPRLHGALPELRLTVQSALDGTPVPRARAREVAPIAGAMLGVLHDARVPGLPIAGPDRTLASAAARRALHGGRRARPRPPDARPPRPPRGARARHRASSSPPTATSTSASCSTSRARCAVLDFDEACLAPRALDVASYAANLVSGRPGDLARADAALARCSTATASAAAGPALVPRGGAPAPRPEPVPAPQARAGCSARRRSSRPPRRCSAGEARDADERLPAPLGDLRAQRAARARPRRLLAAVFATKPGEPGAAAARRRAPDGEGRACSPRARRPSRPRRSSRA